MNQHDRDRPGCFEACRAVFRDAVARVDPECEVHISTERPIVVSAHVPVGMKCPHGVTYWAVPTTEQIADWADRGIA